MKIRGVSRATRGLMLAGVLALAPVAATAETLADALVSAYRHSGLLEQNRALLRAADEDVAVALSALAPTLSYAINAGWSDIQPIPGMSVTGSASLSASLLIYDFGATPKRVELARENVMVTRNMLEGVEQQVLLRAVSAFLNVRSAAETAQLQANNVRLITKELQAARDRFEVGEITQTEVSLAEARLAAARAAEASASGALIVAREEYKAAMGHYPRSLSSPPSPPVTVKTLDEARALARKRHPDMRVAQRNVTIAEMNVELALLAMKPTLSGNATFSYSTTGTNTNAMGLTLSGPIYQGGRLSALYRKAQAQRDATRAGLHVTQQAVDQAVGNAFAQLAIAAASREATDRQIRAMRVALRGTREEQALGARTTLDVLNAEQDLLDAQDDAIAAQSNQYLAVYSLLSAMGLLNAEHLRLGVPEYDPEAYYNTVTSGPPPLTNVSPQGEKLDAVLDALLKN